MKLWNVLLTVVQLALVAALAYFFVERGFTPAAAGQPWTSVEVVTLVLAAVALLITALGIFLAIMAIWGYAQLRDEARLAATKAAEAGIAAVRAEVPKAIATEWERRQATGDAYGVAAGTGKSDDEGSGQDANRTP